MILKKYEMRHEEEFDHDGNLIDLPEIEEERKESEHEYPSEEYDSIEELVTEALRFIRDSGCYEWSNPGPITEHDWIGRPSELRMDGSCHSTSIHFASISPAEIAELNRQIGKGYR